MTEIELKDLKIQDDVSMGEMKTGVEQVGGITHETDPTVPDWAKQAKKPTYSYDEITDKPDFATAEQVAEISEKVNATNDLVDSFNQDLSDLTNKTDELEEYSIREVSLNLVEDNELSVELKDKEGNVIASAETTLPMPDLTGYVKNTDYATASKAGVVKGNPSGGIRIEAYGGGLAYTEKAPNDEIDLKVQKFKPIVPANLDHAVKVGVTTNTKTLTDDEKAIACEWLGAATKKDIGDINTALDELHAYAQSLVGGGVEE